jgi:hypothetical protein
MQVEVKRLVLHITDKSRMLRHYFEPHTVSYDPGGKKIESQPRQNLNQLKNDEIRLMGFQTLLILSSEPDVS